MTGPPPPLHTHTHTPEKDVARVPRNLKGGERESGRERERERERENFILQGL